KSLYLVILMNQKKRFGGFPTIVRLSKLGPHSRERLNIGPVDAAVVRARVAVPVAYQLNPFNYNPLRRLIGKIVDFEQLRQDSAIGAGWPRALTRKTQKPFSAFW